MTADLQRKVTGCIRELSETSSGIRWTPPEQLHFTLKFLGEQPPEMPARLAPELREVSALHPAFDLKFGPGGVFPRHGEPRVLWLGLAEGQEPIAALAESLESACFKLGLPREDRVFRPHLTIGRVKASPAMFDRARLAAGISGRMTVDGFALIESVLSPGGPTYRELQRFKLGNRG